jgi:hypothetical protein
MKKYTAIQVESQRVDQDVNVKLSYGRVQGSWYSEDTPKEVFDTEQEALENAYEFDKHATWLIVPIIEFDNF